MKRALVLSGGGCKGAFEVGAVEYLVKEAGRMFHLYAGTSVGALNAAILGQARHLMELQEMAAQLKEIWLTIKGNRSIYRSSILGYLQFLFQDSLYVPSGLKKMITSHINPRRLFDPATVVKVTTVAMETGELLEADTRDPAIRSDYLQCILASASIPLLFPAVPFQNKHWYDGGLRNITPLCSICREQPDEIYVIVTHPLHADLSPRLPEIRHTGAVAALLRTIDILTSEVAANDLQLAYEINRQHLFSPSKRPIPIYIIAPDAGLAGNNALDFIPDGIAANMRAGFVAARHPRLLNTDFQPNLTETRRQWLTELLRRTATLAPPG